MADEQELATLILQVREAVHAMNNALSFMGTNVDFVAGSLPKLVPAIADPALRSTAEEMVEAMNDMRDGTERIRLAIQQLTGAVGLWNKSLTPKSR